MNDNPLIFDIRHFALDDGPGIRTTVFFKGCPLSCAWCQNPESIKHCGEIAFHEQLCIGCGRCTAACPEQAVTAGRIRRETCKSCGTCSKLCPSTAIKRVGKSYSTDELVDILIEDRIFYDVSGGGVTFSGGEPTLHMDYLSDVLMKLKQIGVHVTLQTSGMFQWSEFQEKLLPYIDLIFFDIKLYDRQKHRQYTGRSNERILHNFKILCNHPTTMVVPTIPLIPGITATRANLGSIARFLKQTGCHTYELRPYNPGGILKRVTIGQALPSGIPHKAMTMKEYDQIKEMFRALVDQPIPEADCAATSAPAPVSSCSRRMVSQIKGKE